MGNSPRPSGARLPITMISLRFKTLKTIPKWNSSSISWKRMGGMYPKQLMKSTSSGAIYTVKSRNSDGKGNPSASLVESAVLFFDENHHGNNQHQGPQSDITVSLPRVFRHEGGVALLGNSPHAE